MKVILTIFVMLQMLLTPAAAGISAWTGPPTISATTGNDTIVDGWEVASNATILGGEFTVNEYGGEADGNGIGWVADMPGQNFTSSGVHDGTTGSHFDDMLSLAPNGSFTSVATLDDIIYNFGVGYSQSSAGIFEVAELLNIPGNVTNGSRNLAHGDIPAAAYSGGIAGGTLIGQPLPAGTDAWLEAPQVTIPNPILGFNVTLVHWEHFDAGDGAWMEYRLDGGAWNWLEPVGGYPDEIDSSAPVPTGAPSSGSGFPVWGSDVATGWQMSNFELDDLEDASNLNITNASTLDLRLRVWTTSTSPGAPGFFFDDLEIENRGGSTGYWHHGCYNSAGVTCFYMASANSALEFPVDLSTAVAPITVEFTAEWDLEGSVWDNFKIETSDDQVSWTEITNVPNIYGIPHNGYNVGGTNYLDESGAFLLLPFTIPSAYAGDSTTWVRIRVTTDASVHYGGFQDSREGLTVDRAKVTDTNSVVHFDNHFTSASSATHYASGGSDDWGYVMIGAGGLYMFDDLEESPSVPSSEWTMANPAGLALFEYGTVASCTNCVNYVSPSSAHSPPYAFATGLDTSFISGQSTSGLFTPIEAHIYTPQYVIPLGASARFVFQHSMCAYRGYSGGALFISTDSGSTWDHYDPGVAGTGSWYEGPNMYTGYSHSLITPQGASFDVWDGYTTGCTVNSNWEEMVGDLTTYGGQTVEFRFTFVAIYNFNYPGWYIDDIGVEVDYFDSHGEWVTPLIGTEDLGNGFVDVSAISPPDTEITATVYDSGMSEVAGFVGRELPLSLAGLDLSSVASGIHVGININTDDPYVSGLIETVHVGSYRTMLGYDLAVNGWQMGPALSETEGNITNDGTTTDWITSEFVPSTRPIQEVYVDGDGSGVRVFITDSQGNQYGGLPLQSRIYLPRPQSGFGVEIEVGPGDWIESMYADGEFWQPALNPLIDAVDDGNTDWYFGADPNYGHFGWQNRIAGDGLTAGSETTSEAMTVEGTGSTGSPPGAGTTSLVVSSNVQWSGSHSYDILTVAAGGSISPASCGTLTITANEIIVEDTGSINADSIVWDGPGAGGDEATSASGAAPTGAAGGAGHASAGGAGGGSAGNGGATYGTGAECGSSGGNITGSNPTEGGRGGVEVVLVAGAITVDGAITSNGEDSDHGLVAPGGTGIGGHGAGGGSGGSLMLKANTITIGATGSVHVRGGAGGDGADGTQSGIGTGMHDGGNGGGGGSGGFIEFVTTANGFTTTGTVDTSGGNDGSAGAPYGSGVAGTSGDAGQPGLVQYNTFSGFGGGVSTTTVLVPAQGTVYEGFVTFIADDTVSDDLEVTIAGVSAGTFSAGWEIAHVDLDPTMIAAIHGLTASHTDVTGRDWFEVEIEISTTGDSYDLLLGSVIIGYHLSETVTGLEDQMYDYHEGEKVVTTDDSISIPLRISADAGTIGIDGEIYHELLITNEPYTVPETLYPDGQDITITTGHHHLYQTTQIDHIILSAEASSGQSLQFELMDVQTNPTFLQTIGTEAATLDTTASSVSLVGDAWTVDWVFQTSWHWDDEAELLWSAQAYNHTGYGLAPATALTGGPGTQAIENDLELDSVQFTDQLGRVIEFMPGIPPWVQGDSEVEISGSVRFQNTLDTRPSVDDFLVSVNLSGNDVLASSTGAGVWSTTLQIPISDQNGMIVETVQATPSILQVGPTGANTAEDVSSIGWNYPMRVDTNAPIVNTLHVKTSFGLKDADGYTWDPAEALGLQLDIVDLEGMSDSITLHYWRESFDDIDGDGIADEEEYWPVSKGLVEGRIGEQYIDLPLIDVALQQNNKRVSLYITGTDFVGLPFANGGGPGVENDLATVVTAVNTATAFDFASLTLDRVDERLLLGQTHELSMRITEENGIETLDEIRVQLLGEQNAPRGEFIYVPKTDTWYASEGSYIIIDLVTVEEESAGTYAVRMYFSIDWEFPVILANNFQSPAIMIFDDDMVNPVVAATNLGEIRWKIDFEVKAVIDVLQDSTPPVSESSSSNLIVQQGDEVMILGHIGFADSGAAMVNIPSGLIVEFHLQYGSTSLDEQAPVAPDGTFEIPFLLPDRPLAKPTLELEFSLMGLIGNLEDTTSPQSEVTIDSTAPRLQFVGQTLNVLYSDNMHGLTVTAQVTEEIGMPQTPLLFHWVYRLNGAAIGGSEGTADLMLVNVAGATWTYQAEIDFNPADYIDLADNPQLMVWAEGTDMAGYPLNGEGTEVIPISPALVLKTFEPAISYVEVLPTPDNIIKLGSTITVTVTMVNQGNQEGDVNVSLVESDSAGEWRTIETRLVTLGPGKTERMDPFEFTVVRSGQQSLYLMLDENYVGLMLVESPIVETPDAQSGGFAGVDEETWMGIGAVLFIIIVATVVLFILRRGGSDDDYWYEDDDDAFEGKSDPGASFAPAAPAPPPPGPVAPPPAEPALTYVSDWQQLPSNGDWDQRPDGVWYVTGDGQQWKQEEDGSFHRMI